MRSFPQPEAPKDAAWTAAKKHTAKVFADQRERDMGYAQNCKDLFIRPRRVVGSPLTFWEVCAKSENVQHCDVSGKVTRRAEITSMHRTLKEADVEKFMREAQRRYRQNHPTEVRS